MRTTHPASPYYNEEDRYNQGLHPTSPLATLSVPDKHQLRICKDTVKNPMLGKFLGGPSAEEAEKVLREKFHFSDAQIARLKA